jgi:hypothetical protein
MSRHDLKKEKPWARSGEHSRQTAAVLAGRHLTELKFNRVDTLYGANRTDQRFDEAADERVK